MNNDFLFQFSFDFNSGTETQPCDAKQVELPKVDTFSPRAVVIYSFNEHKEERQNQESSKYFSEILNLVRHFK